MRWSIELPDSWLLAGAPGAKDPVGDAAHGLCFTPGTRSGIGVKHHLLDQFADHHIQTHFDASLTAHAGA